MDPFLGAMTAFAAAVSWAFGICLFKKYGDDVPSAFLTFFKGVLGCVSLAILLLLWKPVFPTDGSIVLPLVVSGIIGITIGDTTAYMALQRLGAQVTATTFSLSTPMAAILAYFFLDESPSGRELAGMVLTTGAVVAVLSGKPPVNAPRPTLAGIAAALISPLGHAVGIIIAKPVLTKVHFIWAITLRLVPATLPLLVYFLWDTLVRRRPWPRLTRDATVGLAVGSLVGGTIGFLLLTVAVQATKASVATAISSTYPIWVIPCAAILLKEKPSLYHLAMTGVAVGGIFLMVMG